MRFSSTVSCRRLAVPCVIAASLPCVLAAAALVIFVPGLRMDAQTALPSLSDPAISPDGQEIVFVAGGDIWAVAAGGGQAHLLVTNPATESRPLYSPDGGKLAFVSTRTGAGNIYILTLATGSLMRLTYSDSADRLDGWSADGRWLYFTSGVNDVSGQGDIFRVSAGGGTPLEVSAERYMTEFESAPSPDGHQIALLTKGISAGQWWRNGHAHIDLTELWLKPTEGQGGFRKLLPADAKHAWPMWSADGKTLFYMADGSGSENIWSVPVAQGSGQAAGAKALTHFASGRVLWPSIGDGGKTIVFERDFGIWRMDTVSGNVRRVPIELRGSGQTPAETRTTETVFRSMNVSPDGKKLALLVHGQMFAASVKEGGEGERVHTEAVAVSEPQWSPDSLTVAYVAERLTGAQQLELYNFASGKVRSLTAAPGYVQAPAWSPDGKSIAYALNNRELHLLTLERPGIPASDKILASGELDSPTLAWSPDNQWIAFTTTDARSFRNISVIPASGGQPRPITFLANGQTAGSMTWSPDGKFLVFDTAQRSEQVQLARVDLLPHVPRYREDEFRDLFRTTRQQPGAPTPGQPNPVKVDDPTPTTPAEPAPSTPAENKPDSKPESKPESKPDISSASGRSARNSGAATPEKKPVEPVRIVFEGIRGRLTILPIGLSAREPAISPDGKTLLFSASTGNQQSLYTYSLDELSREPAVARQLTSTPGRKTDFAFTPDSKDVVFLENGGVRTINLESRTPKPVLVSARVAVDFASEKRVVFEEAWGTLNRRFFDAGFNGRDWRKLHDQWLPYILGAQTPDELRRNINLLIGELNSSHSGINRPAPQNGREDTTVTRVGNLGLRFDRAKYEAGQGLVVREVIQLGPAAIEGSIKPGDKLIAIDGEPIAAHNLDHMLEDTVNHRTVLSIQTAGKTRDAVVRPVANATASGLLYRQWVEERRAYVDRISGGKVGYVHMQAMGDDNLQQLYLDLDAANESKQAVVIDIRNNNGGYINGYALDVFTRRNYLEMTPRDQQTHPSRQDLGQRALGLPTVLVTNESTLSDGEDFTEGYRTLQLGKVVGEPTAGWIIFTGAQNLIDGSSVRVPFTRVQDTRGETMEMHPRPVNFEVDRSLGETQTMTDLQLERAVKVLLSGQ